MPKNKPRGLGSRVTTGMTLASATCGVIAFAFEFPQKIIAWWKDDGAGFEQNLQTESIPLPPDLITVVGTDSELGPRLAGDLLAYLRPDACPDLRLKLDPISPRDTAVGASGQPGSYLEGGLTLMRQDSTEKIKLVGNGKGPAAFENAYGSLLDSAVGGMTRVAPECIKGSTE